MRPGQLSYQRYDNLAAVGSMLTAKNLHSNLLADLPVGKRPVCLSVGSFQHLDRKNDSNLGNVIAGQDGLCLVGNGGCSVVDHVRAMLSRQQPYRSAARILGVTSVTIVRHARRFQTRLLQLDPSGYWESKVRLGLVPKPDIACIYCGQHGSVHYRGTWKSVHGERKRYCWCDACNRTFSSEPGGVTPTGAVITGHLTAPYRRYAPRRGRKASDFPQGESS